jgi:hypothetical protein
VYEFSLNAAIRDIKQHPRGELFRRLIAYGPPNPDAPKLLISDGKTVLSDPECGQCVQFIFSHMVNRFKGELAELLSIAPCITLVKQLSQAGQFSENIELYFGETIQERRRIKRSNQSEWGNFTKGSDGLVAEKMKISLANEIRTISIHGLIETKSMPISQEELRIQLNRHKQRLQGGVMLDGEEWAASKVVCHDPIFITFVPSTWQINRAWSRDETEDGWRLVFPDPTAPPVQTTYEQVDQKYWKVTLEWSKEAIEQAAYEMTFWYMSQVGKVVFENKPIPKEWEGMSLEEVGYNSIKMMLYYVILRYINPRQGQQAIKLYNAYSFGYPLAVDAKDMIWPEDLVKPENQ